MFKTAFSGISVNNLTEAKKFYSEILGCKILDDKMGLFLELPGRNKLFIYEKPDHVPATFTVLNFEVEDIDKSVKDLKDLGVIFEQYDLGDIKTDEDGIVHSNDKAEGPSIAWFKDPAGNIISVLED